MRYSIEEEWNREYVRKRWGTEKFTANMIREGKVKSELQEELDNSGKGIFRVWLLLFILGLAFTPFADEPIIAFGSVMVTAVLSLMFVGPLLETEEEEIRHRYPYEGKATYATTFESYQSAADYLNSAMKTRNSESFLKSIKSVGNSTIRNKSMGSSKGSTQGYTVEQRRSQCLAALEARKTNPNAMQGYHFSCEENK
jgi:hypothetical protein